MKKFVFISVIFTVILACFQISYAGTFYDILDTKYEGIVESLAFLKIVDGVDKNIFDANKVVTRAELAKMLVIAHGYEEQLDLVKARNSFDDVKSGAWYYDYVSIASAYGLLKGYPDGNFYPDKEVTYAEAVAMILRSLGHNYIKEDSEYGWYFNYIQRMRELKLNEGMDVFYNDRGAKRGDIAILIWNMLLQNTWEVVEEEGNQNFTYVDSGNVLLNKTFGKEYELVDGKRIKDFSALDGKMYATIETYGEVKLNDVLPVYAIGGKVTGVLHKKDKLLSCAVYDIDLVIVDGYEDELEKDGYKLKGVNDKYYLCGNNSDYIFYALKRDDDTEIIDRAIILDLENKIYIESYQKEKDILTINDDIEINTKNAFLLDGKRTMDWGKVGKKDTILKVGENIYIFANKYKSEDEIHDEKSNKTKADDLYYISTITYNDEGTKLRLISTEKSRIYDSVKKTTDFNIGDLILVTLDDKGNTNITKASTKEYDDLKLGKSLILNYSNKAYTSGMLGKYVIDKDTDVYLVNKKYKNNSNSELENCTIEKVSPDELQYIDKEVINIIAEGSHANTIFIERETNKFSVFYARVKDVILDKDKIKLSISPVDDAVKTYDTTGKIDCEIGDMISYTIKGTGKSEALKIDEVYRGSVIGYKYDLIVKNVDKDDIYLSNGEQFNKKSSTIEINGKSYKVSNYKIILSKVRENDGAWVFSSASFSEMKNVKFAVGDRIAIDELEGVMLIYSGYTD